MSSVSLPSLCLEEGRSPIHLHAESRTAHPTSGEWPRTTSPGSTQMSSASRMRKSAHRPTPSIAVTRVEQRSSLGRQQKVVHSEHLGECAQLGMPHRRLDPIESPCLQIITALLTERRRYQRSQIAMFVTYKLNGQWRTWTNWELEAHGE